MCDTYMRVNENVRQVRQKKEDSHVFLFSLPEVVLHLSVLVHLSYTICRNVNNMQTISYVMNSRFEEKVKRKYTRMLF